MRRAWVVCMVAVMCLAVVAAAQPMAPNAAPPAGNALDEKGRVILPWETFRELTAYERKGDARITLPWNEVEDMLGIKVENAQGAELDLDWRQFRALLQWSVQREKPKPEALPADYVISTSDFTGMLRKEGATFEVAMVVNVLKKEGWKRIPILPTSVALSETKLPENAYLSTAGNRYELLTDGSGRMEINLKFAAAVSEQAGANLVRFETVPSATTTLKLTVPQENVAVNVAGAQAVLPLQTAEKNTVVGAALPSGTPVQITWERALEVVEKVPPKLYAETSTLVAVGDGILTCRARVDLSVLHSGIRQVVLSVPAGVSVLEVTGAGVHDWRVADSKLEVRFARDVVGNSQLKIAYERTAEKEAPTQIPLLRVGDVVREKGYIGVVAVANVEIAAPEHGGATAIDVRELPADILQMTSQPILLAFRYIAAEPTIALLVKKHEDVPVLLTLVDSAVLTVMQTEDGRRITKAIYNVRNNRNQYLRLALPKGADVWSATVAGSSTRPAMDEEGRVLLPLVRSGGESAALASFPIEIVYVESQENVGRKGTMRMDLPVADEPVTHFMVQLYLPDRGSYKEGLLFRDYSFEGPLRKVESFSMIQSAPRPPAEQVAPELQAKQLQEQFTQRIEAQAVAAGVSPIRVELPIRGRLFRFEKILVIDEPLHIAFKFADWNSD